MKEKEGEGGGEFASSLFTSCTAAQRNNCKVSSSSNKERSRRFPWEKKMAKMSDKD